MVVVHVRRLWVSLIDDAGGDNAAEVVVVMDACVVGCNLSRPALPFPLLLFVVLSGAVLFIASRERLSILLLWSSKWSILTPSS